jgi:hypothetical protein
MSDFIAGPPSGADGGGGSAPRGLPPLVLLAALLTALLIAGGVIGSVLATLRNDDLREPVPDRSPVVTATTPDQRVLLMVSVDGSGIGRVRISPSEVSCNRSCEYKFTSDVRVTATALPASGSTFEGWGDACSGKARCSFVMDRPRSLSARFAEMPAPEPLCDGLAPEDQDPSCLPDEEDPPRERPRPGADCRDGRDNDDDGLTDTAQDPDCEESGSESGVGPSPSSAPPAPAPAVPDECTDGRDNDADGLTDTEQDPDCEKGRSESG